MALRNYIFNKRGQILIEGVFLTLVLMTVLVAFKQLIDFQKSKEQYRFSKNTKERGYVRKTTTAYSTK